MSTVKTNNVQIGQSLTASQNFTWYQPASPDGTVRLGNGNAGSVTDLVTVGSTGNLTLTGTTTNFATTAARITGYFGPTLASRVAFQSSSANTNTHLTTFPSGTATNSGFDCYSTNDGTNASRGLIRIDTAGPDFRMNSDITGTGTYLPITFFTSGAERMRLDVSGNLGLGVTPSTSWAASSAFQLSLSGFQSYANSTFIWQNAVYDGTNTRNLQNASYALAYEQNKALGSHIWYNATANVTAGSIITVTPRMTLDASGNLLVGTTSQIVFGVATGTGFNANTSGQIVNSVDSNTNFFRRIGTDGGLFTFYKTTTSVGSISITGSATTYNTSSDQRLKTNIAPSSSAIQSILDFPVDQFDWIESGEHQDFGAVAQKAINVIPEMVSVPADEDEMWGIDWSKAVPRLIKTIQELSAQIETLKQKVNV